MSLEESSAKRRSRRRTFAENKDKGKAHTGRNWIRCRDWGHRWKCGNGSGYWRSSWNDRRRGTKGSKDQRLERDGLGISTATARVFAGSDVMPGNAQTRPILVHR